VPAIKTSAQIAEKYGRVTPGRTPDYEAGVRSPRTPYAAAARAAEPAYEAGVTAAIQRKAFGKGVAAAGDTKWQQGSLEKGTARYGPGVQVAAPAYAQGFEPFRAVIERTQLPPRRPTGDPGNIDRVRVMSQALAQAARK